MSQNNLTTPLFVAILLLVLLVVFYFFFFRAGAPSAEDTTGVLETSSGTPIEDALTTQESAPPENEVKDLRGGDRGESGAEDFFSPIRASSRAVKVTDGVAHTIPLTEILSGGPGKDGIPSIDNPTFVPIEEGDEFLLPDTPGIGISIAGDTHFYPFSILVWHEIVNDTVGGVPVAVTYCPLCRTGVVYDRRVNGTTYEFGVSGRLWQSNLLMYNRTERVEDETLFSQVLGEGVVGPLAGEKLTIVPSSIIEFSTWKEANPNSKVLSFRTNFSRNYGIDPYEGYYTSERVSFGASFTDDRLHPKVVVLGVEIDGNFKAYPIERLPKGVVRDTFAGETIRIEQSNIGEVRMFIERAEEDEELLYISGFWFSWAAVHPATELYSQ